MKIQRFSYLVVMFVALSIFIFSFSNASAGTNAAGYPDGLPCPGGGPDYRNKMVGSFTVRFDRIGEDTRYSPGFDAAWHAQCTDPSGSGALQNLFNTLRSDISSGIITKCSASNTVVLDNNGNIKLCADEADSYITVTGGNWSWNYYEDSGGDETTTPPTGPPTITGFAPTSAVPGQSVEVYGTNLTSQVQLELNGSTTDITGNINFNSTETTFEVPLDIQPGDYSVIILSPDGDTTSPIKLKVIVGGATFTPGPKPTVPTEGLPTDLGQLIEQIFGWSLALLGIAVFVMFFYAGFLWLTAAGNTAKVGEAKTRMTNAVFGAILLLSSYLILNTINPNFVKNTFNLPGIESESGTTQP